MQTENRGSRPNNGIPRWLWFFLLVLLFCGFCYWLITGMNLNFSLPSITSGSSQTTSDGEIGQPPVATTRPQTCVRYDFEEGDIVRFKRSVDATSEWRYLLDDDSERVDIVGRNDTAEILTVHCNEDTDVLWADVLFDNTSGWLAIADPDTLLVELVRESDLEPVDDEEEAEEVFSSHWLTGNDADWIDDGTNCPSTILTGNEEFPVVGSVETTHSTRNRVREWPGFPGDDPDDTSNGISRLDPGDQFVILGESVCQDGYMWLPVLVYYESGQDIGWMAEGGDYDYVVVGGPLSDEFSDYDFAASNQPLNTLRRELRDSRR